MNDLTTHSRIPFSSYPSPATRHPSVTELFVAVFGLLLASFPARNLELWAHLADGRALLQGTPGRMSPTWLYDFVCYGVSTIFGGAGLVAVKAAAVAVLAVLLLRLGRLRAGSLLSLACTVLALLAVGSRVPLTPATVSCLLLCVAVRQAWQSATGVSVWPGWGAIALFLAWGNTDRWFILGLGVVALIRFGRWLDDREGGGRGLLREMGAVAVLTAAAAMNPAHLVGFPLPLELGMEVLSPFGRTYRSALGGSPAALACYPLIGLGLISFLLMLPQWHWQRFLPWLVVAALASLQARTVPLFAIIGGPVLAWNLHDFFARWPRRPFTRWERTAAITLTSVLAAAFLFCAWPGWLQRPPFEPRRWAVEAPAGLEQAASAIRDNTAPARPPGGAILHLSRDTAALFGWFCPEEHSVHDSELTRILLNDPGTDSDKQLPAAGINRVVVHAADSETARRALAHLLADPTRWPLLHLKGGVAIFGYRGPALGQEASSEKELDLERLAFQPTESALPLPVPRPVPRTWWDAFVKRAPQVSSDRDQASVLLLKAELARASAPSRHLAEWESYQAAALAAAAAGWLGPAAAETAFRLAAFRPPLAPAGKGIPPITRYIFDCQQMFVLGRDDAPLGIL